MGPRRGLWLPSLYLLSRCVQGNRRTREPDGDTEVKRERERGSGGEGLKDKSELRDFGGVERRGRTGRGRGRTQNKLCVVNRTKER